MIRLIDVSKVFGTGVAGLDEVTLSIEKGEFVYLIGHTGSGKTTLLRLLIREMLPTKGSILVDNLDIVGLPNNKVSHLRKKIGVVFQDLKLLPDRTIFENVLLPLQFAGLDKKRAMDRVEELLSDVGIIAHRDKFPVQLSGGELQRAAIARALTLEPDILLADEPTGNLDTATAFGIMDVLNAINARGTTIVMATHNPEIITNHPRRVVELHQGKILRDESFESVQHHLGHHGKHRKTAEKPQGSERKEEVKNGTS